MKYNFSREIITLSISIISIIGYGVFVFASYAPGETLDPTCNPGVPSCDVTTGWNFNTTSHYVYNTTDSIGIGTATPGSTLEVDGGTALINQYSGGRAGGFLNGFNNTLGASPWDTGASLLFIDGQKTNLVFSGDLSGLVPGLHNATYLASSDDATGMSNYIMLPQNSMMLLASQNTTKHSNLGIGVDQMVLRHAAGPDITATGDWHDRVDINDNEIWLTYQKGAGSTPGVDLTTWTEAKLDEDGFSVKGLDDLATSRALLVKNNSADSLVRVFNDGTFVSQNSDQTTTIFGGDSSVLGDPTPRPTIFLDTIDTLNNVDYSLNLQAQNDGNLQAVNLNTNRGFGFAIHPTSADYYAFNYDIGADVTAMYIGDGSMAGFIADNVTTINDWDESNYTWNTNGFKFKTGVHKVAGVSSVGSQMFFDNSGNFTITPSSGDDVLTSLGSGSVGVGINNFSTNSNGEPFQVGNGGTSVIGYVDHVTGNWVAVSDARKKENIENLNYGLDTIMQLTPKSYTMKEGGGHSIGFLAQDVKDIVPESVFGSEDKGYGMSYATLVPVVVKAIQDLDLKISNIETVANNLNKSELVAWFADKLNGINKIFVHELCLTDGDQEECLTLDQVREIKQNLHQTNNTTSESDIGTPSDSASSDPAPQSEPEPTPEPSIDPSSEPQA